MINTAFKAAALALPLACCRRGLRARALRRWSPSRWSRTSRARTTDVEFMDYVGTGQVIKLAPRDVLVLSYLKSCEHETITGGTVPSAPTRAR